jgi:hypothetical protein
MLNSFIWLEYDFYIYLFYLNRNTTQSCKLLYKVNENENGMNRLNSNIWKR